MTWLRNSLSILILCVAFLLLLDIAIRYWFWKEINLIFNPANFNNIVTPVGSILSTLLLIGALYISISQNKLLISQNVRPYFEDAVKDAIADAKIDRYIFLMRDPPLYTLSNLDISIKNIFQTQLLKDTDYREDLVNFRKGQVFSRDYYEGRSYYDLCQGMYFTFIFSNGPIELDSTIRLLQEINKSDLHKHDKMFLKRRIRRFVVGSYMDLVEFNDTMDKHLMVPIDQIKEGNNMIQFMPLSKTTFRTKYDKIVELLKA